MPSKVLFSMLRKLLVHEFFFLDLPADEFIVLTCIARWQAKVLSFRIFWSELYRFMLSSSAHFL